MSDLRTHEKICGQIPKVSCPYCPHKAFRKCYTNLHIKRKHPGAPLITSKSTYYASRRTYFPK